MPCLRRNRKNRSYAHHVGGCVNWEHNDMCAITSNDRVEKTIMPKHKKNKVIKTKRPVDKSQPVMKIIIPKFQDEFYKIGTNENTTSYYNPILNIVRYEQQVDNEIQRNSLLSWITENILGISGKNEF